MFLAVILILCFLVILYVLLVPIVLFIDTATNLYYLQIKGLAKANIEGHKEELLKIKLKVLFMTFSFYPLKKKDTTKQKKTIKIKKRKRRKKIGFNTGLRLLKSFKVKQFFLNIDTGDCISNAKLYPVFALLNYKTGSFNVNFEGRNQMILHIENRPVHIIRSFINI